MSRPDAYRRFAGHTEGCDGCRRGMAGYVAWMATERRFAGVFGSLIAPMCDEGIGLFMSLRDAIEGEQRARMDQLGRRSA